MAGRKLNVVICQAPGKNPVKRALEEDIATQLMLSGKAEVSIVPHLYDLTGDHTGMVWLKSLKGDLVVLGWLFPRAIRWVLDRNGVKGQEGQTRLEQVEDDESDVDELNSKSAEASTEAIGAINVPNRLIYTVDLRNSPTAATYVDEIKRLADLVATPLVQLSGLFGNSLTNHVAPTASQQPPGANLSPFASRSPFASVRAVEDPTSAVAPTDEINADVEGEAVSGPKIIGNENARRRWYPVIDYSRCTNCMECLDFCLFGVYGVDLVDRILVEQEDNCKKGCPACSRVCPANAIVFPEHKTPAIAGAAGGAVEDFKIDLSKLFGAPSALEMAVLERDEELVADGREAVGATVGLPKRQSGKQSAPRDNLDDLMDGLDAFDV